MRIVAGVLLLWMAASGVAWGQGPDEGGPNIQGTTPEREAVLRGQIRAMAPEVLPRRIIFLSDEKYVAAARAYRLRVPDGMSTVMFTHLPSRSVYVNTDLLFSDKNMGLCMAHELGHLATNSVRQEDAERAAGAYRKRLREFHGTPHE